MVIAYKRPSEYSAATVAALRNKIGLSEISLIASSGSDITTQLQNMLNTYNVVSILVAGTYLISSSIQMPSNSHLKLANGVILKLEDSTNDEILTNSDYVNGNSNITIDGGTFDCNGVNNNSVVGNDPNTFQKTGILFKNVDGLSIENIKVKDPAWFGIQLGKVTNFTVKHLVFDYTNSGGDCVHLNGQCRWGVISDIKAPYGITRDDTVALIAKDVTQFNIYEGAIQDIDITGIEMTNALTALRIISVGYEVKNITARGIYGSYRSCAVNIDSFSPYIDPVGDSIIKNIIISDVSASNTTAAQFGIIWIDTIVESITIENLNRSETGSVAVPTFAFGVLADVKSITINNVNIRDYTVTGTSKYGIYLNVNSKIGNLLINNYQYYYLGSNTAGNRGQLIKFSSSNSEIKNLIINNIVVDNISQIIALHGSTIGNVMLSNCTFNNCSGILTVNVEDATSVIPFVNLNNVSIVCDGLLSAIFAFQYTISGSVRFIAKNFNINGYSGSVFYIQPNKNIKLSVCAQDFSLPSSGLSALTPLLGDMIMRSGSSISMNNDLVKWDGLRWVLMGGYNYTDTIPTTGSWFRGNYVLNNSPYTGYPKGWICIATGTFGTLNGGSTTGSINSGSSTLTVNSNTGLSVGNFITIAGVSGIKKVTGISGTTITIDSNSNATVTDAAVAYSACTFASLGNL